MHTEDHNCGLVLKELNKGIAWTREQRIFKIRHYFWLVFNISQTITRTKGRGRERERENALKIQYITDTYLKDNWLQIRKTIKSPKPRVRNLISSDTETSRHLRQNLKPKWTGNYWNIEFTLLSSVIKNNYQHGIDYSWGVHLN